jgi:hypothetical protein
MNTNYRDLQVKVVLWLGELQLVRSDDFWERFLGMRQIIKRERILFGKVFLFNHLDLNSNGCFFVINNN